MIEFSFSQFLTEAPFSAPGAMPPGPPPGGMGGMGGMPPMGPPMGGGMGAMPPPPMGGGLGGPMGPPGMGGPQQQQPTGPTELKSLDVWKVLEELLGLSKQEKPKSSSNNNKNMLNSRSNSHLMT